MSIEDARIHKQNREIIKGLQSRLDAAEAELIKVRAINYALTTDKGDLLAIEARRVQSEIDLNQSKDDYIRIYEHLQVVVKERDAALANEEATMLQNLTLTARVKELEKENTFMSDLRIKMVEKVDQLTVTLKIVAYADRSRGYPIPREWAEIVTVARAALAEGEG
jgi:hypothetical protein